jgi:hypothetical protein
VVPQSVVNVSASCVGATFAESASRDSDARRSIEARDARPHSETGRTKFQRDAARTSRGFATRKQCRCRFQFQNDPGSGDGRDSG